MFTYTIKKKGAGGVLRFKKDYSLVGGQISLTWEGATRISEYLEAEFMVDTTDHEVLEKWAMLFINPRVLRRLKQLSVENQVMKRRSPKSRNMTADNN